MQPEISATTLTLGPLDVLCDGRYAEELTESLFDPRALEAEGLLAGEATGRGTVWFIHRRGHEWVLRHYRRGGLIGRFVADRYWGRSLEKSRAWAEWRLLADLSRRGLPVPRPIAAAVCRNGLSYRADLITEKIPGTLSLAARLQDAPPDEEMWAALGRCLRRFHDQGVYHADLNAHNILIDAEQEIYLIDFDRCALRRRGTWMEANLQRLHRSLLKLKAASPRLHFEEENWRALMAGYASGGGS